MKHMGLLFAAVVLVLSPVILHAQEPPATPSAPESTATTSAPETNPTAPAPKVVPMNSAPNPNNLIRNGDFEHSKQGWETHGKMANIDGRNALEIDTGRREPQNILTTLKVERDMRVLKISFEVKAEEGFETKSPTMGAIRLKIHKPNRGYTYHDVTLKSGTDWQTIHWQYEVPEIFREFTFDIEVRPGKGSLYFTHFVIEGLEG